MDPIILIGRPDGSELPIHECCRLIGIGEFKVAQIR
jgi:hypothetical protein